ncbi:MAG: CocE/NonD family hydrolase [Myxococcota bacterium]
MFVRNYRKLALFGLLPALGLPASGCGDNAASACPDTVPQQAEVTNQTVQAADGTELVFSVFRPPGVCEAMPAPLIFWNHGYPEARTQSIEDAQPYLDRGYAFVSLDQRGILGESGGFTSGAPRPGIENMDASLVLDWIHDELDWVQKDPDTGVDKDLVVGTFGNGGGGSMSLLLAAFDARIDAVMPYVSPSSAIEDVFGPNNAPRASIASLFLELSATLGVRFDPDLVDNIEVAADTLVVDDELRAVWESSDVATYGSMIDVPAMFVQPIPDQIAGSLRAAEVNYGAISTPTEQKWLVGMNAPFLDLGDTRGFGVGAPSRERPNQCADIFTPGFAQSGLGRFLDGELVFLFLDAYVARDPDARARMEEVPRVLLPIEQEGCVRADGWPVATEQREFEFSTIDIPQDAPGLELPLFTATEPTLIAGTMTLGADIPQGQDELFLASLLIVSGDSAYVANDMVFGSQTGPFAGTRIDIRLGTVVTLLQPGDEARLLVEGEQFLYARAGGEIFEPAAISNVVLRLPIADTALIGNAEAIAAARVEASTESTAP